MSTEKANLSLTLLGYLSTQCALTILLQRNQGTVATGNGTIETIP